MFRGLIIRSAKSWYQRIKSRPSFRPLLADTVRGMAPSATLRRPRFLGVGGLAEDLKARARAEGFDDVRITALRDDPVRAGRLSEFLASGHHGSMDWMAETAPRRASPLTLWPDARSAVVLAQNYAPDIGPDGTPA